MTATGEVADPAYAVVAVEDARGLADLTRLRADWAAAQGQSWSDDFPERMRDWWDRQGGERHAWLVRGHDGSAVAMANVLVFERMPRPGQPPSRWAYAANVWVDPAHRRQGVASLLMGHLVQWCRAEGLVRIVLAPSEMSRGMYARLGFVTDDTLAVLPLR